MERSELISIRLKLLNRQLPSNRNVSLVAVSKKYPIEDIKFAYDTGQTEFGENRVDELVEKSAQAQERNLNITWHFIGNLQSNKISKLLAVPNLKFIHSIDSYSLLSKLYDNESVLNDKLGFFLQIKTSDEKEKSGFDSYDELSKAINLIFKHENSKLQFQGLMTMSKVRTDNFEEDARLCFRKLKNIQKQLQQDFGVGKLHLSMGMSSDYQYALEEGSDVLRLGSSIFALEVRD
tara:strand:+ start:107282 stop:107986 length:705 start_codon:yes stop_codon:yes gene_type:complete